MRSSFLSRRNAISFHFFPRLLPFLRFFVVSRFPLYFHAGLQSQSHLTETHAIQATLQLSYIRARGSMSGKQVTKEDTVLGH